MSDILIRVAGSPTRPPLCPFVNGRAVPIAFDRDVAVDAATLGALAGSDIAYEIVSRPGVVDDAGETSDGAVAGGTGGSVASVVGDPALPDRDRSSPLPLPTSQILPRQGGREGEPAAAEEEALLAIVDLTVPKLTAALPGLSRDQLETLLAAECTGKTRASAIAAIEAAIVTSSKEIPA
jgi:hypothetical protein